jgi:pimeloyl-ACP methyl ester carboxylesterase
MGGQLRVATGLTGVVVIGWDLGTALSMAAALAVPAMAAAELLPAIEAAAVAGLNARMVQDD